MTNLKLHARGHAHSTFRSVDDTIFVSTSCSKTGSGQKRNQRSIDQTAGDRGRQLPGVCMCERARRLPTRAACSALSPAAPPHQLGSTRERGDAASQTTGNATVPRRRRTIAELRQARLSPRRRPGSARRRPVTAPATCAASQPAGAGGVLNLRGNPRGEVARA